MLQKPGTCNFTIGIVCWWIVCGKFPSLTSYVYPDLIRHGIVGYVYIGQSKGCSGTKDKISRPTHLLRSCKSPLDGRLVDHPMQSQAVVNVEEERFPLRAKKVSLVYQTQVPPPLLLR